MGEHIDTRKNRHQKKSTYEGADVGAARRRRASFKNYLRDIEEELLETELKPEPEPEPDERID